jgi:hypothetical protein
LPKRSATKLMNWKRFRRREYGFILRQPDRDSEPSRR